MPSPDRQSSIHHRNGPSKSAIAAIHKNIIASPSVASATGLNGSFKSESALRSAHCGSAKSSDASAADSGWESETKLRLWKKREELENRKEGNDACQFYQREVQMVEEMSEARKLIKGMQKIGQKVKGIIDEVKN